MSEHNIPTPHIAAQAGEIAETILLPGDPLRAKYIADNFCQRYTQRAAYGGAFWVYKLK